MKEDIDVMIKLHNETPPIPSPSAHTFPSAAATAAGAAGAAAAAAGANEL